MISRAFSFLLCVFLLTAQAEEQVRSTQEELRRRNIYFGDIDGRRSGEFEAAVKRYQQKKGFTPTGREDAPTLRSLGLLARSPDEAPPKELSWPEEPVLKSDTKVDVVSEVKELAAATGIAPASIAPANVKLEPIAAQRPRPRPAKPGATGSSGDAAPAGRGQHSITPTEMLDFVKSYLKAVSQGDLGEELGFYADHVDYYGNGKVDRRVIEFGLRRYYSLWPKRSYSLKRLVGYTSQPRSGQITITYEVNFSLKSTRGKVKGSTLNKIVINAGTASPRIVSIRESRVRP